MNRRVARPGVPPPRRRPEAGVTLIEMMIVLVVIGVATGAATLGLGAVGRADAPAHEARRLATVIGQGIDDALISGVTRAVAWDARGYRVGTGGRHDLPAAVTLTRSDFLPDAAVLSANAASVPLAFVLTGGGDVWHVDFDGLSVRAVPGPAP
jgi:general secretion pathway protein H